MNKLFILILFIICFAVYFNALGNNFVLDDFGLVVDNPLIKSPKFLTGIFKTSLFEHPLVKGKGIPFDKMYRPLQTFSYFLDYKIWGLNPFGFHLTNVIIHFLNTLLVYYLLFLLFNNTAAKLTSLLFVIHPIQTSVVSYISGRADLLVAFFILLSTVSFFKFLQSKAKVYYLFSLLSAALAFLCRENAMILFLFILSVLLIIEEKQKHFLYIIPFVLLDLTYLILRFLIFGYRALTIHNFQVSFFMRSLNFFNIIPRYIKTLILPVDLHLFRTTPFVKGAFDVKAIMAVAFICLYIYLMLRFRKNKLLFFCLFWFLIGLTPIFFFIDAYPSLNSAVMAESWIYIPCVGFFGLFSILWKRNNIFSRAIFIFCFVFYALLTAINNYCWKNNITLYKNTLAYSPLAGAIRQNLINEYLEHGLYKEAKDEIYKFGSLCPECSIRYLLQGNYYYAINNIPKAVENFQAALVINEYSFVAYYKLSLCFERLQQLDKAIDFASKSTKINPYYLNALIKLGDLYSETAQYPEAKKYYQMALNIDPSNKILEAKLKDAKR